MQEFHVETIGSSGDCAVLRITGEIDAYTRRTFASGSGTSPPRAPCTSLPT